LVLKAAEMARSVGIANLLQPGLVKEMIIADILGHARRERCGLSPDMALRLGRLFGNSPEFWLNAQRAVDLWDAALSIENDVARIQPLHAA